MGKRLRLVTLLIGGPVLALLALDRAVVHWDEQWVWAAREVPARVFDPYRAEAVLRSTPPGRANVVLLGNSVVQEGLDRGALEARFRERGLRFPKVTIAGSAATSFGMLAHAVAELEPRAAVYVVAPPDLRSRRYLDHTFAYDARAVPALFGVAEVLAEPRFHLDGLLGQLHVFARHRRAMQRALLVWLGNLSWAQLSADAERTAFRNAREDGVDWVTWMKDPESDAYPNPNTRALGYLARQLREVGAPLVVVEAPLHPMQLQLIRRRVGPYRAYLRELAAAEGFSLATEDEVPQLEEFEFEDWVHANERGRERLTSFLGDYLDARL